MTRGTSYLPCSVKEVEMPPRTPVEEATVLLPNVFPHFPPVVHKAHEALDPEGCSFDGERGNLPHAKSTQARAKDISVNTTSN